MSFGYQLPLSIADSSFALVLCIDAKVNIDDNADFRQKEIFGAK